MAVSKDATAEEQANLDAAGVAFVRAMDLACPPESDDAETAFVSRVAMAFQAMMKGFCLTDPESLHNLLPYAAGIGFGSVVGQLTAEDRGMSIIAFIQAMNEGIAACDVIHDSVGGMQ